MFLLHDGTKTSSDYWNNQIILELVIKRGAHNWRRIMLARKSNFLNRAYQKDTKERVEAKQGKVEQNNKRRLRA